MNTEPIPCPGEKRARAAGTVNLTFLVRGTRAAIWCALTDPAIIRNWFGDLSAPLREGGSAVLDFGDGDFFTLDNIYLMPPYLVQYTWQFLGIGPQETIRWQLEGRGDACVVTITDMENERPAETAILLREGWLDFLARLDRFFTSGRPTRYEWRREFDGSIELPCSRLAAWDTLMGPPTVHVWLSLQGKTLETGAHLTLKADREYDRFAVAQVEWKPPDQVSFEIHHPGGSCPTQCCLRLSDRSSNSLMSVRHLGWEGLSLDLEASSQARRGFSRFWIEALTRARWCCQSNHAPTNDSSSHRKEII